MDGARSLTRAPYSLITTLGASGRVHDYLALSVDSGVLDQPWRARGGLGVLRLSERSAGVQPPTV